MQTAYKIFSLNLFYIILMNSKKTQVNYNIFKME